MVKGITKQVIVVKGHDSTLFEQAIFLVRDNILSEGGITEEQLLQEAKMVCRNTKQTFSWLQRMIWSVAGAAVTGCLWLTMVFI